MNTPGVAGIYSWKPFRSKALHFTVMLTYGVMAVKRDLAHVCQIISKRHLCPLQLLSYTLEISLSIMELQWPEFLIMHSF